MTRTYRIVSFIMALICAASLTSCGNLGEWYVTEQGNGFIEQDSDSAIQQDNSTGQNTLLSESSADLWYPYEETDDFIYEHDFMASRDGQGYHWWIYLEITYIIRDYGKRAEYDFTLDHWTAERIYPLEGGYYNAVISQNNHDISMDLLFHPDERKYIVLYAQYENGDRTAGVNQISYSSQSEWADFDFHEDYDPPSVENPFEDICESSVSITLYIPLSHYCSETGYTGKWSVREQFGRSPFFDYLVESEEGFFWFCVDICDSYTYIHL